MLTKNRKQNTNAYDLFTSTISNHLSAVGGGRPRMRINDDSVSAHALRVDTWSYWRANHFE